MWYWQHDDSEDDTTTPELGWKDKFKSYFGLALLEERVNDPETEQVELPIHCRDRLSQNETQEHEDYVHSILVAAEDMQFEARKIIDLQGEAAVCDDPQQASSENCKAMARDVITLKVGVYKRILLTRRTHKVEGRNVEANSHAGLYGSEGQQAGRRRSSGQHGRPRRRSRGTRRQVLMRHLAVSGLHALGDLRHPPTQPRRKVPLHPAADHYPNFELANVSRGFQTSIG